MFHTCLDDTLQHLSVVENNPLISYSQSEYLNMRLCRAELRMYRILLWCIPDCDEDMHAHLNFIATSIAQLFKVGEGTDSFALTDAERISLGKKVNEKRRKCQDEVKKDHYYQELISLCSIQGDLFTSNNDTIEFLDSVHAILDYVVDLYPNNEATVQIQSIGESVSLLRNMVYFTDPQTDITSFYLFIVHDWARKAGCLSLLLGLVGIEIGSRRLYNHLQMIVNPCNPEFIKLCFQVIKAPKMKPEDRLLFGEFVFTFLDFFLENLVFVLKDDFPVVREGLIFLLTFLADFPLNYSELMPLVRERIYSVLDQASDNMWFYCYWDTNIDLSTRKTILDDFLKSIEEVREDIVNLYVHITPLSWTNFPRINRLGYLQCLLTHLENLRQTMNNDRKLVPFLKHKVITIRQELLPLKLFLQNTLTMQNEHDELKDIWEQITSLLYQADFAIKSSFFTDDPIWYNLTSLSSLVTMIKDIQHKLVNVQFAPQTTGSHIISKTEAIQPFMSSIDVPKPSTSTSNVETVVGFDKEIELLIDRLTCGSKRLEIVSIVGMGGIGKTTLAKVLYNKPTVKNHFHKLAFCSVSQVYRKRNVLLGIMSDVSVIDDTICQIGDDDLAHLLRQRLLGSRYLIILDDIWDISVWNDLRGLLPDDFKGSRVIFTTRINSIALIARQDSTLCELPLLSNDESWELLQQKVFHKDPCPRHLLDKGMSIAMNCKGLPLAIVVIAGLLAKTERSLTSWNEVAKTLSSFASIESCRDIIKLSYKHLPESLKSCFLYLGAVMRDYGTDASVLEMLWIAEGFVSKSGNSSVDEIAKNYLNDLGDRNLITVIGTSLNGGIQRFRVHDLIHEFCRTEAGEEHYMCYINEHNKSLLTSSELYPYRIFIEADHEGRFHFDAKPRGCAVHSLLYFDDTPFFVAKVSVQVYTIESFLCNFKLVELLDLKDIIIDGEFPMIITTLVHLRHLALRFSAVLYVPPDIINLWNLETFVLWASEYFGMCISLNGDWVSDSGTMEAAYINENLFRVYFPSNIWKMKRLRHVQVNAFSNVALDDVSGVFSLLPDLISFGFLYVPCGEEGEELLRRLSNVQNFSCYCLGRWDPDRECNELPKLEILTKLETLSMVHSGEARPPYMFSFPSTIRELILKDFGLPWK